MTNTSLFKQVDAALKSGKEHSMKYEDTDLAFARYLRTHYYNVMLDNYTVSKIRQEYVATLNKHK